MNVSMATANFMYLLIILTGIDFCETDHLSVHADSTEKKSNHITHQANIIAVHFFDLNINILSYSCSHRDEQLMKNLTKKQCYHKVIYVT